MSISDEAVHALANHCSGLESLLMDECKHITDQSCASIGEHCRSLRTICVAHCVRLTDQAIMHLSRCHSLERVNITGLVELSAQALGSAVRATHIILGSRL